MKKYKGLLSGINFQEKQKHEPIIYNKHDQAIISSLEEMLLWGKEEIESKELIHQVQNIILNYKQNYLNEENVPKDVLYWFCIALKTLSFYQPIHPEIKQPEAIKRLIKDFNNYKSRHLSQKQTTEKRLSIKDECFTFYKNIKNANTLPTKVIIKKIIDAFYIAHPNISIFPRKDETIKKWIEGWKRKQIL